MNIVKIHLACADSEHNLDCVVIKPMFKCTPQVTIIKERWEISLCNTHIQLLQVPKILDHLPLPRPDRDGEVLHVGDDGNAVGGQPGGGQGEGDGLVV